MRHCLPIAAWLFVALPGASLLAQDPESPAPQPPAPVQPAEQDVPTLDPTTVVGQTAPVPGSAGEAFTAPPTATTATGTPEPQATVTSPNLGESQAGRFGGTVRVVTREQLERSGATQVEEAIQALPGLNSVRTGPLGGLNSVFLRGANSQHTKVLLDGVPLNDPSGAGRAFDFSLLSVDQVERIEVLSGPQSVLYGSDAIGGVVNVVTRRGSGPPRARISLLGGTLGTHREAAHVSGGTEVVDYSIGGSWRQTDGFSAAAARVGGVERDGSQLGTLGGRLGVSLTDNVSISYVFRWLDAEAEIDDASFALGAPPTDDPLRVNLAESSVQRIESRWSSVQGLLEHVVSFHFAEYDRFDRDDVFPFRFAGRTRQLRYYTELALTDRNVLTTGVDYQHEEAGTSSGFGSPSAAQNDTGWFVLDQWSWGERLFLSGGVRWTDHSAAGRAETYRATALVDVFETGTVLRGSIGTGFRAPSLAENLFPFGNPGLRPERSKGWEWGGEQRLAGGDVRLGAVYFRNDLRDLILFDLATFTLQNIGAARTHGVEAYAVFRLSPRLAADVAYTRLDTLDLDTTRPLVRRPRDKWAWGVTRLLADGRGQITCTSIYVGRRTDSRDGSVVLDPYLVTFLSGGWRLGDSSRLLFRINNVFDTLYEPITGFAGEPLNGFAGAELTF